MNLNTNRRRQLLNNPPHTEQEDNTHNTHNTHNNMLREHNENLRLALVSYSRFIEEHQFILRDVLRESNRLNESYHNIVNYIIRHPLDMDGMEGDGGIENTTGRVNNSLYANTLSNTNTLYNLLNTPLPRPRRPLRMTRLRQANRRRPIQPTFNPIMYNRRNSIPRNRNLNQSPVLARALYSAPFEIRQPVNRRLDTNTILDNTTQITYEEALSRDARICPIGYENFDASSNIVMINGCQHVFNRTNLFRWFDTHSNCPICRFDLLDPSGNIQQQQQRQIQQPTFNLRGNTQRNTQRNIWTSTNNTTNVDNSGTNIRPITGGFEASIDISPLDGVFDENLLNTFTNTLATTLTNSFASSLSAIGNINTQRQSQNTDQNVIDEPPEEVPEEIHSEIENGDNNDNGDDDGDDVNDSDGEEILNNEFENFLNN